MNRETARQELNTIKSAINAISDRRQRQVLTLNYLEGKPVEQVRLEIKRTLEPFEPIKKSQYYTLKIVLY